MPLIIEGQECACLGDPTSHGSPLAPGIGAITVLYNGRPIWRVGIDFHACPIVKGVVPDVGGVVVKGALRTVVMGSLAARKGDMVVEVPGGPNAIIPGAMGVGGQAGQVQSAKGVASATGETPLASVNAYDSPPGASPAPAPGPTPVQPKPPQPYGPLGAVKHDNGDIYVGNILIKNDPAHPDYADKKLRQLEEINNTPSGKRLLDDLKATGKHVRISNGTPPSTGRKSNADAVPRGTPFTEGGVEKVGTGKGTDSDITMPESYPVGPCGGPPAPEETVLFHELTHAKHNAHGDNRMAEDPINPAMGDKEEENTIRDENEFLKERGFPYHHASHGGNPGWLPNTP